MSNQNNNDNSDAILLVIFVLFAVGYGVYYIFAAQFITFWFYIRWPFVMVFQYLPVDIISNLFFWSIFFNVDLELLINNQINLFSRNTPSLFVENRDYIDDANLLFQLIYLPFVFFMTIYFTIKLINRKTFNIPLTLKQFREQESKLWPTIKPAIYQSKKTIFSIDDGEWAMSTRPESFANKKGLVSYFKDEEENEFFRLNYDISYDFFVEQLGVPWTGIDNLRIEERYLLAILLVKANRETERTKKLLNMLGNYYTSETGFKIKLQNRKLLKEIKKEVNLIIKDIGENSDLLVEAQKRHYYKLTVFSYLLEKAREDGVLASGEFLWLKPLNRQLFYMMSTIGRRLPFFDSAGGWSHYIYEKAISHFSSMPKVSSAVYALDNYFESRYHEYVPLQKDNNQNNN